MRVEKLVILGEEKEVTLGEWYELENISGIVGVLGEEAIEILPAPGEEHYWTFDFNPESLKFMYKLEKVTK